MPAFAFSLLLPYNERGWEDKNDYEKPAGALPVAHEFVALERGRDLIGRRMLFDRFPN
jgi:hypothetical protein